MAPDDLLPLPLRVHLIEDLRRLVPFDHFAWLVTDPETWVGSAPLADIPPALLPQLPALTGLKQSACSTSTAPLARTASSSRGCSWSAPSASPP